MFLVPSMGVLTAELAGVEVEQNSRYIGFLADCMSFLIVPYIMMGWLLVWLRGCFTFVSCYIIGYSRPSIQWSIAAVINLFRLTDHLVNFVSVRGPPRPSRVKAGLRAEKISIYPEKFPNDLL